MYLGLSTTLAILCIWKFLKSNNKYSEIRIVLMRSFSHLIKYFFVIILLFIGSCIIGIINYKEANNLFYKSEYYSTLDTTMVTVFSLTFGDSIYKIIHLTYDDQKYTTIIYFLCHWLLFMAIFLRFLLKIIEDTYKSIRYKSHLYWLDNEVNTVDYLKMEVLAHMVKTLYNYYNLIKLG